MLHIVSSGALTGSLQQSLFMPLLTRLPRPRVKALVACLSPGAVPSAVLRQSGVPTYDLPISRNRFSPRAFQELLQATRNFRPDVIQAWGHTAQIVSAYVRKRCEWKPQLIWSIADTAPLAKDAGLIDRQKLKYAARSAARADRIVYSSEAAASQHRRVGFPESEHVMIPPGVDATRFKPDFAARRKLREQLNLPGEAFVIGMSAPFQPENDFATLLKAAGELIKGNPNIAVVLAGHGAQKGNAPLMALIGGGALSTRVHLLGEWSDISALYNACDVVCSSAVNDQSRMNLVIAMLCGVPCVATGIGAQGEVIGQHGVAVEPGNPAAFVKGITRVMQMTPEKRTHMAQGARKHALANYVHVRSLQKYLQLYYDLIGRQSLVAQDLPAPEVDPTLTVPPALPTEAELNAARRKPLTVADLSRDPDSLEAKVTERTPEELPKWRIEQEQERSKREAEVAAQVAATKTTGDVLQVFESQNTAAANSATPMTERARGVADDVEELLSPDALTVEVPALPRMSNGSSSGRKSSNVASQASQADSAKQAALKAAQRAALQPIAPTSKGSATAKPSPAVIPVALSSSQSLDFNSTQPMELLPASVVLQTSAAPVRTAKADGSATQSSPALAKARREKSDSSTSQPVKALAPKGDANSSQPVRALSDKSPSQRKLASAGQAAARVEKADGSTSQPLRVLSTKERSALQALAGPAQDDISSSSTHPMATLPDAAAASTQSFERPRKAARADSEIVDSSTTQPLALTAVEDNDGSTTAPLEVLPEIDLTLPSSALATATAVVSVSEDTTRSATADLLPEIDLSLVIEAPAVATQAAPASPKTESVASPLGRLAKALATAAPVPPPKPADPKSPSTSASAASGPAGTASMTAALEKWNSSFDIGELSLMATGMWAAKKATKAEEPTAPESSSDELSGAEALSLISTDDASATLKREAQSESATETKRAANGDH